MRSQRKRRELDLLEAERERRLLVERLRKHYAARLRERDRLVRRPG
jgi:hypothetical protein